ncbi:MAG TPA: hypothetical protein VN875_06570 [Candidatus Binatus sp.]|nr:hypothetical protein [Candidatus Binatus sp.]
MSEKRNEYAPMPQTFISKDKVVTVNRCGPMETYTEVDRNTGQVTTTTYIKTTP